MKRLLIMAAAVAMMAVSVYGQGQVNFSTLSGANGKIWKDTVPASTTQTAGRVVGADGMVGQLYWSPVGMDNFQAFDVSKPVGTTSAGNILGGTVALPGQAAGTMVQMQLRVWETAYGATFEAASTAGAMGNRFAYLGTGSTFTVGLGGGGTTIPVPSIATLFQPFAVTAAPVPEPSVVALGLVGAGALLLLRRRK